MSLAQHESLPLVALDAALVTYLGSLSVSFVCSVDQRRRIMNQGHASSSGSFVLWFGPLFDALRCCVDFDIRSRTMCVQDGTSARELLLGLLGLPAVTKQALKEAVIAVGKDDSTCLASEPRLSGMDVAELLEHFGADNTTIDTHVLHGALRVDGSIADLRLLLSLLNSTDEILHSCTERIAKYAVVGSPLLPGSPMKGPTRLAEVQPIPYDRCSSPQTSRGARVERPLVEAAREADRADRLQGRGVEAPPTPPVTTGAVGLSTLLWRAPVSCSPAVAALLSKPFGTDPTPPAPLDPQHPQRVMDSTPEKLVKRMMKDGSATGFFADLKYDGERLIGFRGAPSAGGGDYRFFSRNMLPVPERKLDGIRALLDSAFGATHQIVFDAEILSMHTFGSMNEVHKGIISVSGPRIYVFDILWWNGHSLVSSPLTMRKELLHRIVTPTKNVAMSTCYWVPQGDGACSSLELVFNDAMSKRLEGFVLKPSLSTYRYNGTDWVKLKKGYMAGDPDRAGAAGFVLFPGGPRIRRVDGVDVTTLAHGGGTKVAPLPLTTTTAALQQYRLYTGLVDTVDCLIVGLIRCTGAAGTTDMRVLLGVPDVANNTITTVGVASDPFGHCRLSWSMVAPLATSTITFGGADLVVDSSLRTRFDIHVPKLASIPVTSVQIVEVSSKGLVEDARHSCGCSLSPDAHVLRPRDDKSLASANTRQQVMKMFAYAIPVPAGVAAVEAAPASTEMHTAADGISVAMKAFNDMHWYALPSTRMRGEDAVDVARVAKVVEGAKVSAAGAAKEASTLQVALQVVLVPVAVGKRWVEKGTMRDVTTLFGATPSELCNVRLAVPGASAGDIVVCNPCPRVLCFIGALLQLVSPSTGAPRLAALADSTVIDITLVRLFGFLVALAGRKDVPAHTAQVTVHVDTSTAAEFSVWKLAFDGMLAFLHQSDSSSLKVDVCIYKRYRSV
jgi:ATP-dependent DNA ligase